jgi:hypothetical protein
LLPSQGRTWAPACQKVTQTTVSEAFNPYQQWLGLRTSRPKHDYELLGLKPFEADPATIASAADRAIARVRGQQPGEHAQLWSKLLDELNNAKRRLTDPSIKARYDAQLRNMMQEKAAAPASGSRAASSGHASKGAAANGAGDDFRYPPGAGGPMPQKKASTPAKTERPAAPQTLPAMPTPAALTPPMPTPVVEPMQPVAAPWGATPAPQPVPGYAPQPAAAMPMQPAQPIPGMPMQPVQQPMPGYPQAQPAAGWYGAPNAAPMQGMPVAAPMATMPNPMAAMPNPMAPIDPMSPYGQQAPMMGMPIAGQGAMAPGISPQAAPIQTSRASTRTAKKKSSNVMVYVSLAGCVAVIAGAIYLWKNFDQLEEKFASVPAEQHTTPAPKPAEQPAPAPAPAPAPMNTFTFPAPANMSPTPTQEPQPMAPAMEMATPIPAATPVPATPPTPAPAPTPTPTPTPTPVPAQAPDQPLPTKQEVADLAKALSTARLAIVEGNIEEAKQTLAAVEPLNKLPEHDAMYARLVQLADYNDQFWNAVKQGMKGLESGSELEIGSTVITVVEVLPDDKIVLRIAGRNQTFPLKELKAGIAMAIAEKWFRADDPNALVMKGAYAAVNKAGNIQKAKEWWNQAIQSGVNVSSLLPVLDDQYEGLEKDLDKAMQARTAQ